MLGDRRQKKQQLIILTDIRTEMGQKWKRKYLSFLPFNGHVSNEAGIHKFLVIAKTRPINNDTDLLIQETERILANRAFSNDLQPGKLQ